VRFAAIGTADPLCGVIANNTAAVLIQLDDLALAGRLLTEAYDQKERMIGLLSPDVLTALLNMQAIFARQEDVRNNWPFVRGAHFVEEALKLPTVDLNY
jgi:hypothetical protein